MARVIGVVSGKGGVGKTTVVANLAFALSKLGKKVTVIDCNLTTSHLGFLFDFYFYPTSLNDVLAGRSSIEDATFSKEGINIIPSSLKVEDLKDVEMERLKELIANINSDFVLLDSAPGLGREALNTIRTAQEILFVATPYLNSVIDVAKCDKIVRSLGLNSLGIVLNMVKGYPHEMKENEVEEITRLPVIAKIPYDEEINKALSRGELVLSYNPFCPASLELNKLASKICGVWVEEEKPSLISKILLSLKHKFWPKKPSIKPETLIEKI